MQVQGADGVWRDAEPVRPAEPVPPPARATSGDVVVGERCGACGVRKIYLGEGMGYMDRGYSLLHGRQCVGRSA